MQNQAKNISMVLSSSPNQNLRQIGPGIHELWSDIQTDKQRLLLYTFIDIYKYKDSMFPLY